MEIEPMSRPIEIQPAPGSQPVFDPTGEPIPSLSTLKDRYHFSAAGFIPTRVWCRENAQVIRHLQSDPDLYMHGGRFWEYPFVFNRVMKRPNSRILDIGIGEGIFASILAKHGHSMVGVDNYTSCWKNLENRAKKTRIPCIHADARDLSMIKNDSFDIALLISVIEHVPSNTIWCEKRKVIKTGEMLREEIPEKLRVISEALRVIRPGGLVIITSDIYLDYPQEMNISWKELLGIPGIDRKDFSNLNELYLSDNPIHKGRELPVAVVIEKHRNSISKKSAPITKKFLLRSYESGSEKAERGVRIEKRPALNIGLISVWYERGQAYVTKTIRDALARDHQTFVLARTGAVYPDQPRLETTGFWEVPNLSTHCFYNIPTEKALAWINDNHLDVVVFNEEYDWQLVGKCKESGVRIVTYLDYYKEEWKPCLKLYDAVLCSTQRSFNLVKNDCNAHYIGWGIDADLYRPSDRSIEKHTFFHNAGWLGINYRKMTPKVISAFDSFSRTLEGVSLFIHSQASMDRLPEESIRIIENNPKITFHAETVPAPGLYQRGEVHVYPSKLEGLGLPLLEGLSSGLPTITTDAPPMNEFVKDGCNGLLVKVSETRTRDDDIAFPETIIDPEDLSEKMRMLAKNPYLRRFMSRKARENAEEMLSLEAFRRRLNEVFDSLPARCR